MTASHAKALQHDRGLVLLGILVISLLSWLSLAGPFGGSGAMTAWSGDLLVLSMVMWTVMMVAMMLPTATPMILCFHRIQHQRHAPGPARGRTGLFVAGYLLAWSGYGLIAALAQWGLHGLGVMTTAMGRVDPLTGGLVLMAAGAFQWSGFKHACLSQCRSPLNFLLNQWRDGGRGALFMGLHHGAYCVGCCWALMLLMFAGGVMNLAWMGAIALYVLLEKLVLRIRQLERTTGVLLLGSGLMLTVTALLNQSVRF